MSEVHDLSCDILIIGGGVSGIMAAITACEQGARVIVADLAHTMRSGDAGHGNDHLAAYLNEGGEWDTGEGFLKWMVRLSQGFIDPDVAVSTSVEVIPEMVSRLEKMGVQLRDPKTGTYVRTGAFDMTKGYFINFEAFDMKPRMVKNARKSGASILDRVMITDLILHDGNRVAGAVGFHIRTGVFTVIHAKAVVLSTGSISQLWENPTPYMFNVWHGAYNGAASYYLAWQAGAEIANCELSATNVVPKGFSSAGFNAMFGMGGHLVNAAGERFLFKHHEKGEKGPRWLVCWAVLEEQKAGRGPVYVDVRHFSAADLDHLTHHLLPVDKLTFMDYLNQKGVDLSKELLEVDLSEQALSGYSGKPYGVIMDRQSRGCVEGLFLAGAVSTPCYALSGAFTTGIAAGRAAGKAVRHIASPPPVPNDLMKELREKIYRPLSVGNGISWQEFERKRQAVMTGKVGFERNEAGLTSALEELESLEEDFRRIRANNYHELMRTAAAGHLLQVSKIVAWGALERKESRFGHGHHRTDYPETLAAFNGSILLKKAGSAYSSRFIPAHRQSAS